MKSSILITAAAFALSGCIVVTEHTADTGASINHSHSNADASHTHDHGLPPGSNEMLRAPISGVEGIEVLVSDVIIPPNATVPRHFHPGEEFVYVLEGSAVHVEEGKEDQLITAGNAFVIPPEAVHAPRGGPDGARAVVFRVHKEGQPERILVDE